MFEALRTHTGVHLRFLARSRVFHGFVLLIVVGVAAAVVPMVVSANSSSRFMTLRALARQLHEVASVVTAGIALLVLWSHRQARSIKIVATTPAPFAAWVASVFLTAAVAGLAAQAVIAALVAGLSVVWNVPYQLGFLYIAMNHFASSLIMAAFLTALGAWMHPLLAVVLMVSLGEWTFWSIRSMLEGADAGFFVTSAKAVATASYYLMPSFNPFSGRSLVLTRSMRVSVSDWRYLAATFAYALLALSFGYVATIAILRRKPMI